LSRHGVTYSNARTPANSDSFSWSAGARVTGGSPITHGLYYDVSYDRTMFDPTNVTCKGAPGNMMVYDESIDLYKGNVSQNVIDPTKLPRIKMNSASAFRSSRTTRSGPTRFSKVVKSRGGRTAWADKHPAYDLVNGPSGKGVDDIFTPEITNVGGFDATVSVDCTIAND